jgi:hypothetical protein
LQSQSKKSETLVLMLIGNIGADEFREERMLQGRLVTRLDRPPPARRRMVPAHANSSPRYASPARNEEQTLLAPIERSAHCYMLDLAMSARSG